MLPERPKFAAHGDVACNVAMQLAKPAGRNPRELAQQIVDTLLANPATQEIVAAAEIAGPGFINFRLAVAARQSVLKALVQEGARYGRRPVSTETDMAAFQTDNPPGPPHVGHDSPA